MIVTVVDAVLVVLLFGPIVRAAAFPAAALTLMNEFVVVVEIINVPPTTVPVAVTLPVIVYGTTAIPAMVVPW